MSSPDQEAQTTIQTVATRTPKVVSIMGSGHSGSTVLAIVLGAHPNIMNVGELHKLPRSGWKRDENRRCACGSPIHVCTFWNDVYARWNDKVGAHRLPEYIGLQNVFERSRSSWLRLPLESKQRSPRFVTYEAMTAALYKAICESSGKGAIVDSSKSRIRNYALLLNTRLDVRVIHLVRDGRSVVCSQSKSRSRDVEGGVPKDRRATPPWRSTLHWTVANLQSELVGKRAGDGRVFRLAYERFVNAPDGALEGLAALVDEDLTDLARSLAAGEAIDVGHVGGGNRLRMSGRVVLRQDFEWTRRLSPTDIMTFWRLAGWQARRYGYRR